MRGQAGDIFPVELISVCPVEARFGTVSHELDVCFHLMFTLRAEV